MPGKTVPKELAKALRGGAATVEEIKPFVSASQAKKMTAAGGLSDVVKGFAVEVFNAGAHTQRDPIFDQVRTGPNYTGPIVTAIGDSWFLYPIELTDTIANLERRIAIRNRSWAGYSLRRHVDFKELTYEGTLQLDRPTVVFMSVGGNDLLGGGALSDYLIKGKPSKPSSYLGARFKEKLDEVIELYREVVDFVRSVRPETKILVHGYAYAIPRPGGRWLGKPMTEAGVPNDPTLRAAIVREIVDRWYEKLAALRRSRPRNVTVLDLRDVVTEWFDELHPTDPVFKRVADKFETAL
jgi:hypothetical protein